MTTLNLIRYIAQHPEYNNVVIMDEDDMPPMMAIEYLASIDISEYPFINWSINGSLEKNTLLIYR